MRELPLRAASGPIVRLAQVADVTEEPSEVELDRDDLRQDIIVSARLEGRDLGSAMKEIQAKLSQDKWLPPGTVEYGGLYQQQQESFRNLVMVLLAAILLVFTVLLIEFRSFNEPVAIVFGAILAMFGTVAALWITGITLNIVSFFGAIIGVGIVAKNGILMLDFVQRLEADGVDLVEALVRSGHRRLRPVLMTSLAAALGMLPLAWGIGSGADMLRPLAIAVIGALCISVLLSLWPRRWCITSCAWPGKIPRPVQGKRNRFEVVEMTEVVVSSLWLERIGAQRRRYINTPAPAPPPLDSIRNP